MLQANSSRGLSRSYLGAISAPRYCSWVKSSNYLASVELVKRTRIFSLYLIFHLISRLQTPIEELPSDRDPKSGILSLEIGLTSVQASKPSSSY